MKYLMLIVIISKTQVFRNRKEVKLALLFLIPCLFSPACINHLISSCPLTNTGYFLFICGIRVPAGKVIAFAVWIFSFNRRCHCIFTNSASITTIGIFQFSRPCYCLFLMLRRINTNYKERKAVCNIIDSKKRPFSTRTLLSYAISTSITIPPEQQYFLSRYPASLRSCQYPLPSFLRSLPEYL